jgi:hypothetical protein
VPRGGTTLACELLNRVPDTVALNEPMTFEDMTGEPRRPGFRWTEEQRAPDPALACDRIASFIADARSSIATRGEAVSLHVGGEVIGKRMSDETGARRDQAERTPIRIDKPLSERFVLVVKHPAAFAALLPSLLERFPVFAVVRNPLGVLASWQTVPLSLRNGRSQAAERLDVALAKQIAHTPDRTDRQLHLLDFFYGRLHAHLPAERIIRYEALVDSGGRALEPITPRARELDETLESRNRAPVYDEQEVRALADRLLASEGAYWRFYDREAVERLLG